MEPAHVPRDAPLSEWFLEHIKRPRVIGDWVTPYFYGKTVQELQRDCPNYVKRAMPAVPPSHPTAVSHTDSTGDHGPQCSPHTQRADSWTACTDTAPLTLPLWLFDSQAGEFEKGGCGPSGPSEDEADNDARDDATDLPSQHNIIEEPKEAPDPLFVHGCVWQAWEETLEDNYQVARLGKRHDGTGYGELTNVGGGQLAKLLEMTSQDVFLDVGSGVGQVCLQMAALSPARCYGIELRKDLHKMATKLQTRCETLCGSQIKCSLYSGNAFDAKFRPVFAEATVVWANNLVFAEGDQQRLHCIVSSDVGPSGRLLICTKMACGRCRSHCKTCLMLGRPRTVLLKDGSSWNAKDLEVFVYDIHPKRALNLDALGVQ